MQAHDLVIVGGGPAGMSAALVAGRARVNTLVVDAASPRNAVAHASHGFLTRDGVHGSELGRIAREQLAKYPTVVYRRGEVHGVERTTDGLVVAAGDNTWLAERVVFATGFRSELSMLDLPGVEDLYGRSLFPCPFCDGFENADRPLAIFASSAAGHMVPMVRRWSTDLVVFTNGRAMDDDARQAIERLGVRVERSPVAKLDHEDGMLTHVVLQDGTAIAREAGFIGEDHAVPACNLPTELGVPTATNPWGMTHYDADDFGRTSVPGVYVVGDLKRAFGGIAAAVHDGYSCAASIVHELAVA
jgi:thioredoxin reductase